MKQAQGGICAILIMIGLYSLLQADEKGFLYTIADEPASKLSSAAAYTAGSIGGSVLYCMCDQHLMQSSSHKRKMHDEDSILMGLGFSELSLGVQYCLQKYTNNSYIAHAIFPALIALEKVYKESLTQAALYTSSSILVPLCGLLSACVWHVYQKSKDTAEDAAAV